MCDVRAIACCVYPRCERKTAANNLEIESIGGSRVGSGRGTLSPRAVLHKGLHTGWAASELLTHAGVKFDMTPNGEHQINDPVQSCSRVKILTLHHLCENPEYAQFPQGNHWGGGDSSQEVLTTGGF